MADRIRARRSALAGTYAPGDHGPVVGDAPGIIVTEVRGLAITQIDAWADRADRVPALVEGACGAAPSRTPLSAVVAGETAALWVGPDRWLIVEPEAVRPAPGLHAALAEALGGAAALTEQGHGRVCLRVSGAKLADLLAKGTTIDVEPGGALEPGTVVGTALGHMTVAMHRRDRATADLYVARSFAVSFYDWLIESAAEFGCRVTEPT